MTKRSLLSESSRIFDPLGWLSPIVVTIKVMFQQLWLEKLEWDEDLPDPCKTNWVKLKADLYAIEELEIRRWLYCTDTLEIHGFSDASKDAYAAVLYSRVITSSGEVHTNIIAAKTKVAPIKTVSIPKLELCAATLLVKLMEKVTTALNLSVKPTQFYYTDASIVLDWLSKPPKSWPTYIGNRTGMILSYSNRNQWYHVRSKENSADRATRGVLPKDLKEDVLWWKGPSWLSTDPLVIPEKNLTALHEREMEINLYLVQDAEIVDQRLNELISRVSKYPKIIRIVTYVQRFIHNFLYPTLPRVLGSITVEELKNAENCLIRCVQSQAFPDEIKSIRTGILSKQTKLTKLYPFIDSQNILRVSGRPTNSSLNYDTQHPIILPANHLLVDRMITYFHIKLCHASITQLFGHVKQRFHIIRGKHLVKKIINRCFKCHRFKMKTQSQLMGQLPASRVNFVRPFIQCGIDYAGPYLIKAHQLRKSKIIKDTSMCIFTCIATKAIHFELVTNLTTESFIAALRKFQSTRGISTDLFSDNATNFIGAINYLQELRDLFESDEFLNIMTSWTTEQGTSWHLIPPAAPNFGGLWEAAVKSTKFHLKRVIGEAILSYEELLTVLKQVEAILNSRPLCRNDESNDPLTPAHFIIGHPLTLVPEASLVNTKINLLSRWQMLQKLIQQFWCRWLDEFTHPNNNIHIDDVVILREDNVPPARWPLAKIVAVHPGKDNLRTSTSTFKRPVNKICRLPFIDSHESTAAE